MSIWCVRVLSESEPFFIKNFAAELVSTDHVIDKWAVFSNDIGCCGLDLPDGRQVNLIPLGSVFSDRRLPLENWVVWLRKLEDLLSTDYEISFDHIRDRAIIISSLDVDIPTERHSQIYF